MCKHVQEKKGKVLTTPEMLKVCKKKSRQQAKKKYERNVIKIQVNVMNVKEYEKQEDMEKAGGRHSLQHLSYIAENLEQCKEGNVTYTLYSAHVR